MYAVHNYVCLQISSFGMGIYQQLYTPPMTALVFSTFWAGIGYNFCLKFYQTLLKIRGGADVCPPGVTRTEDVDREDQCWAYPYPLGR